MWQEFYGEAHTPTNFFFVSFKKDVTVKTAQANHTRTFKNDSFIQFIIDFENLFSKMNIRYSK